MTTPSQTKSPQSPQTKSAQPKSEQSPPDPSESTNLGDAALRQLSERRDEASEGSGAARIATLNFVVFVDDAGHRPWVLERAQIVVEKHPARLIVLDSTGATGEVDVATTTRRSENATMIAERVDIGVGALGHAAIIALAGELAVPDIPTVMWWSGARLLASRTFNGLAHQASTVLVDSSGKARDEETIRELGTFMSSSRELVLKDLAFMRLLPWQDMIAQFFDDPALREDLFSIDGLEIESGSDAEALYLACWLGSRLSWEPVGRNAFRDTRGRTVPFKQIEGGDQRRVISVVLTAGKSSYRARLSDDPNVVCLDVEGEKAKAPWCVPLQNIENTSLIERAILENGHDVIFETSLSTVHDLLR